MLDIQSNSKIRKKKKMQKSISQDVQNLAIPLDTILGLWALQVASCSLDKQKHKERISRKT